MTDLTEAPLRELRIHACQNCIDRLPGECHTPGCFFWLHTIDEVPTHLEMYLVDPQEPTP
jgi:hypothetical protein